VNRRELLLWLGGAVSASRALHAQQKAMPVIGFLSGVSPETYTTFVDAFRSGLKDAGFLEGQNVAIEYRWAEDHRERLGHWRRIWHDATSWRSSPAALRWASQKARTPTIPIVFVGTDPVASGLVASFNRPGGNVTGVSFMTGELMPKRLELLHELVPTVSAVAALVNPNTRGTEEMMGAVQEAATRLGLSVNFLHARSESDF
jgi:putative tryptophan/tyrosine transport system substrate-binding protein